MASERRGRGGIRQATCDLPSLAILSVTTVSNQESAAISSASSGAADAHRLETRLAPVHHEDAEALFHPQLDVVGIGRKPARYVEFPTRRQHLLNRAFPS